MTRKPGASQSPTWYECSTLAEPEAVDAVAEVFGRYGQGVAIEEPVVSSADGEQVYIDRDKPVLVKTYVPIDERAEDRRQRLEQAIWHLGQLRRVEALRVQLLREEDWAEAWKKHFFVHRPGQRLVIVPSWRRHRPLPGDLPIKLDPGMAFGTGLHPTTRLCLRALEAQLRGGEDVLDLGCGSGILSIAAAKLGARRVLALDVEPVAVKVASENIRRNGESRTIKVREGSLPLSGPLPGDETRAGGKTFDVVVANISLRVLTELSQELWRVLPADGVALFSGVLERDVPTLADRLERGVFEEPVEQRSAKALRWKLLDQQIEAEWALVTAAPLPA